MPKNIFVERDTMSGRDAEFTGERLRCLETMWVDVICERTGLSRRAIQKFMNDSKFFYAEEAIQYGLANDMLGSAG